MHDIAVVLVRSLAMVAKPIIEVLALRNCVRRRRSRYLRLGNCFEWRSTTAEEFDRNH